MKTFFKTVFRIFKYLLLGVICAIFMALVSFLFFDQPVPNVLLSKATESLSSDDFLLSADSATFSFIRGLRVRNFRMIDKGRNYGATNEPACVVMSASQVNVQLELTRLPWSAETILKSLEVVDFRYPRLPLGYYIPDSIEFPGKPDFREVNKEVKMELPDVHPFKLTLIRPEILGVAAPLVEAQSVEVNSGGFRVSGITIHWADADVPEPMVLRGGMMLDLWRQNIHGEVGGQTRQHHIRPMLVALDIKNSYQFIDAFTNVEKPVDASCVFDVNLRNNDLRLFLDLHPQGGFHHGVPLNKVDGTLEVRVFVRDTFQNARITVGPLHGDLADGSELDGTVVYENTNDVGAVYFDVKTRAPLKDVLAIADVMNDGTLDCIEVTNGVPTVKLNGRIAVKNENASLNDLKGMLAFAEGSLLGIPMKNASSDFIVKGTTVTFTNAAARSVNGGTVRGNGVISVPESRRELATFGVDLRGIDLPLEDLAQAFRFDHGERRGFISGSMRLKGPLETNSLSRLSGDGHFDCREGRLAQMRLFAGFTDFMANHVPGVSGIVNLSHASADFTLNDGVLHLSNVEVGGDLVSVRAEGSYDLVNDKLDFRAQATLTRNESLLGKLATPITWPFANLAKALFDFRIDGSLDDPKWHYNRNPLDLLPGINKK